MADVFFFECMPSDYGSQHSWELQIHSPWQKIAYSLIEPVTNLSGLSVSPPRLKFDEPTQ